MKIIKTILIILHDEKAQSIHAKIKGEIFQFLRYNNNDNDIAIAHRGKVIHTDSDSIEEVVRDRIAKFR